MHSVEFLPPVPGQGVTYTWFPQERGKLEQ